MPKTHEWRSKEKDEWRVNFLTFHSRIEGNKKKKNDELKKEKEGRWVAKVGRAGRWVGVKKRRCVNEWGKEDDEGEGRRKLLNLRGRNMSSSFASLYRNHHHPSFSLSVFCWLTQTQKRKMDGRKGEVSHSLSFSPVRNSLRIHPLSLLFSLKKMEVIWWKCSLNESDRRKLNVFVSLKGFQTSSELSGEETWFDFLYSLTLAFSFWWR